MTDLADNTPEAVPALRAKRALAILAMFLVAQVAVAAVVGIGIGLHAVVTHGKADASILANALKSAAMPAAVLGQVVAAWVVFWMTRRVLAGPVNGGGLAPVGWRKAGKVETLLGLLAGCVLALFYLFVLVRISPPAEGQPCGPLVMAAINGGWQRHQWAIIALLAPPIEEFVFRGVCLEGLSNSFGVKAAAIVVTIAFVAIHVTEALTYWPAWMGITLMGGVALFLRIKTHSLVPAIGAHLGYNLVMVVTVYVRS